MRSGEKTAVDKGFITPARGLCLLVEPEPWLRIFARNIGDLFRAAPPQAWVTSPLGEYWPDALVNRPVAWKATRQSFLLHILVALGVYALNLAWLNQPRIVPEPTIQSPLHYELSEYLPAVNTRPEPPKRQRVKKADPEYAAQEIVVLNENHHSIRQTIVQPSPTFLKQDIPLPNLIASTAVPGAPVAMNHPLPVLPVNMPQIAPPAQPMAQSSLRPLMFPPAAQPEVAAPAGTAVSRRAIQALPLESTIVVPPAPDATARKADSLKIPVQAPPQVAAPAEASAGRALQSVQLPMSAPQVAPPSSAAASRNLSSLGLPSQDATAAPPAQPIASGSAAREKEVGQMLVLNARPVAPSGPLTVPEGNRPGEFTASPTGQGGATAQPEIQQGKSSAPANIYVAGPPAKTPSSTVVASTATPPASRALTPDRTDQPRDRIDNQVFGTRKNYSMRLSMPNLTSSTGSWSIHFAELKTASTGEAEHGAPAGFSTSGGSGLSGLNAASDSGATSDLSAPEAIKKVDPAYPQELMQDRVEGTVVLYAVIHADGSVGDVRVLEGFDARLNENARKALAQWRFRPGTKNGTPVDVEAVVRVPFKVPHREF